MDNIMLTVGNVIIDESNNKKYRVVAIVKYEITLCEMNISSFSLSIINKNMLFSLISTGDLIITNEESIIVDIAKLSEEMKQKFETKKKIMLEVVSAYGPTFMELNGKTKKKEVKKIIEKYDIPKWTFWRMCTSYF